MSAHPGNSSQILDVPCSLSALRYKKTAKPHMSGDEQAGPLLTSASKIKGTDCSYVISACKKTGDIPVSPNPAGRWMLQRRATRHKESSLLGSELGDPAEQPGETRLSLQRRAKTSCVEKQKAAQSVRAEAVKACAPEEAGTRVASERDVRNPLDLCSVPTAEGPRDLPVTAPETRRELLSTLGAATAGGSLKCLGGAAPTASLSQGDIRSGPSAVKVIENQLGSRAWASAGKDVGKNLNKCGNLEKKTPTKCLAGHTLTPKCSTPRFKSPATPMLRTRAAGLPANPRPGSSFLGRQRARSQESTLPPEEDSAAQDTCEEPDTLKVENSQVTVAVRVRPFSKR